MMDKDFFFGFASEGSATAVNAEAAAALVKNERLSNFFMIVSMF
jgi:hypothetical protein